MAMGVSARRLTKGLEERAASAQCPVQSVNPGTGTEAKTECLPLGVGVGISRTNNAGLCRERKLKPAHCPKRGTIYGHPLLPGYASLPGGWVPPTFLTRLASMLHTGLLCPSQGLAHHAMCAECAGII